MATPTGTPTRPSSTRCSRNGRRPSTSSTWETATYPGGARFLGRGRRPGDRAPRRRGRIYTHAADFERYWLWLGVVPGGAAARASGSALLAAASEVAARDGKTGFQGDVLETWTDGLGFLERHGFEVYERMRMVRLRGRQAAAPEVGTPQGIRITDLAAEPGLVAGVHAVASQRSPTSRTSASPVDPGALEEFRARDVDRPGMPPDGFFVASIWRTSGVVGTRTCCSLRARQRSLITT